jgi:hypothetical protein
MHILLSHARNDLPQHIFNAPYNELPTDQHRLL